MLFASRVTSRKKKSTLKLKGEYVLVEKTVNKKCLKFFDSSLSHILFTIVLFTIIYNMGINAPDRNKSGIHTT